MTSSNTFKKLVSIGAAVLLAVGGSLVAAEPASAAVPTPQGGVGGGGLFSAQPSNYQVGDTAVFSAGYWNIGMSSGLSSATHEWFSCSSSTALITDTTACTAINGGVLNAASYQGNALATTYTVQSGDIGRWLKVKNTVTATVTLGDGGTAAPVTVTTTGAVIAAPTATFDANGGVAGSITSLTGGVIWLPSLAHGGAGALPTRTNCFFQGWGTAANSINPEMSMSATMLMSSRTYYAIWSGVCLMAPSTPPSSANNNVAAVVSESAKPLPVWAAPILKQIPTLSKTLTTDGGKLSLTDGDFSSLKSVTVGGKEVAYSIDAKGDVNIPVPAGKGGTTADLVVVFTGGKMTVQDGIKYVEPTNVAAVREAPIAGFKGNSTKITGALAESIQYAAQLDKKANTVLCTGYAASKAAVATATARAEAACGYATKVNDLLVNKKVTIVVNAKLAKTAAVGIKVYK